MTQQTTGAPAPTPSEADQAPTLTPTPWELADAELLLDGAYPPLAGFSGAADTASVEANGVLTDGTPWPVPITLRVPADLANSGVTELTLQDPEGAPVASLEVTECWRGASGWFAAGPLRRLDTAVYRVYGPFRKLRRAPADVAAELAGAPTLAVPADRPLREADLAGIRLTAQRLDARVLVLPLLSVTGADSLVRAALAGAAELPDSTLVVPLPLWHTGTGSAAELRRGELLRAHVAAAYGATHLLTGADGTGAPISFVSPPEMAVDIRGDLRDDTRAGTPGAPVSGWRPAAEIPESCRRKPLSTDELDALLDAGRLLPEGEASPGVEVELRRARPPLTQRGLTIFFTGLSGSGKSTIARGLYDTLLERGGRTVTLLDGDVVRRMLSAGLTFSKADRDLNIRRIGYVAAEVSRHGGLAICAPIAPYASTRAEVRRMVREAGDFVLVHVATPLEECERRDRKGLYAKARAGAIKEFTGISDPYEEPDDADLTIDTTDVSIEHAVDAVVELLTARGWLPS